MTTCIPEPPQNLPVFSINGASFSGANLSNQVTLEVGHPYDVTCLVVGGSPDVTDTFIQCAGVKVTSGQITPTLDMDLDNCSCHGNHSSGCYVLESKVFLRVKSNRIVLIVI